MEKPLEGNKHHTVDYVEFGVGDSQANEEFYAAAFGWKFNHYGPDYTGFIDGARGELEAGGFEQAEKPSTLVVIYSTDLEASLVAVERAGGRVVKPIFGFPGGRRFEFLDPSGNRLAVWSKNAQADSGDRLP